MKILSFDTTNNLASTAIINNGQLLSYNTTTTDSQQAEKLFSLIEQSLIEAKLTLSDLDLISVTNGPGSFTGVRIGLAAALGMQMVCKTKFLSLTNFQVLAYFAKQQSIDQEIAVLLDARREQLYLQKFDSNLVTIDEPSLVNIKDLNLPKDCFLIGDGMAQAQQIKVDAKLLAKATEFYWKTKQYHDLIPLYIRQPDAALKKI